MWEILKLFIKDMNFKQAFIIGCAQSIALFPGVSRLGICLTATRFYGFERYEATKFSFINFSYKKVKKSWERGCFSPDFYENIQLNIWKCKGGEWGIPRRKHLLV